MSNNSKNMTDQERFKLCKKLDKELDDYIDGLEKRSYADGWPEDRWEEEMEKHPFFMTKPSSDTEMSPLIQGLQNLKYDADENTPEELAANYKEDGNYNFKYKNYRLAILSYTEGLKAKCGNVELQSQLLNNRSASHFMLGNYRSALKDAEACLRLQPLHTKAKIRAAQCCLNLGRFEECITHCDSFGESHDPSNVKIMQIRDEALSAQKRVERDLRRDKRRIKANSAAKEALIKAIHERGIKLDGELEPVESLHPEATGAIVTLGDDGRLSWPCTITYPENAIQEFVRQWHEDVSFIDMFKEMFDDRESWNRDEIYSPDRVDFYFESKLEPDTLFRIKPTASLEEVLADKMYVVERGTPGFIVLSRNTLYEAHFLSRYTVK